ncbi:MAG TPA: hypothetical protein VFC46_04010 [Humisphaera sp.]|nr:hypothetical protein [Humisphaera sp.]
MFSTYASNSLQLVRLMHDSLQYLLIVALTIPALVTGAFHLYRFRRSRRWPLVLSYATVVGVSGFLLVSMVVDWYNEVYLWQGNNYGLF